MIRTLRKGTRGPVEEMTGLSGSEDSELSGDDICPGKGRRVGLVWG